MDALWEQSPLDVAGVRAAIKSDRAYSTIKTVLERLTDKGILTRQKVGRAFEYRPTLSRSEYQAGQARELSQNLLSGFGTAALTHFVDTARKDPKQLEELHRLLSELEK